MEHIENAIKHMLREIDADIWDYNRRNYSCPNVILYITLMTEIQTDMQQRQHTATETDVKGWRTAMDKAYWTTRTDLTNDDYL